MSASRAIGSVLTPEKARDIWARWKRSSKGKRFLGSVSEFSTDGSSFGINWNLFDRLNDVDRGVASSMLLSSLQYYMVLPEYAGVQEFTTPGDFPSEVKQAIEVYHPSLERIDPVWRSLFVIKDYVTSKKSSFRVTDITSGLTFKKSPYGDSISVYPLQGSDEPIVFELFGGALNWDRSWFDDRDYVTIADVAAEFRNKYFNDMAKTHYAVVEGLPSSVDQEWVASPGAVPVSDPFYESVRDVKTINAACSAILDSLAAKRIEIAAEEVFIVLAPYELRQRITTAIGTNYRPANYGGLIRVAYAITPLFTKNLVATDKYYVCLPKRKIVTGIRQRLELKADFDIQAYADLTGGWGRFGAVIAEPDQFRRCATSGGETTEDDQVQYDQAIESDANGNPIYIGEALPGGQYDEAVWRIRKITYDAQQNPIKVEWADNNSNFDKVWNDRAGYTYG